jgi:hypothetical protein
MTDDFAAVVQPCAHCGVTGGLKLVAVNGRNMIAACPTATIASAKDSFGT